jgi:hypothetical protein
MTATNLPPCGIYRTTAPIDDVPAGRLVYFHNHGNPGPGIYLPERWKQNRAQFSDRGFTLPAPYERSAALLESLPQEGFYRVTKQFYCCEKRCRSFEADELVQLGYTGNAEPIVFSPEFNATGFTLPETGSLVTTKELSNLSPLKVAERADSTNTREKPAGVLH